MMTLADRLLSFPEVDLYVEQAGSGPAIVFIHDYTLDHELWHESVVNLSSHSRCITYDLRGHGKSSSPDTAPGGTHFASASAHHHFAQTPVGS